MSASSASATEEAASSSSSSLSAAGGDADRAFRLGMRLERAGHARSASAAFHEAATLYQCFLDGTNDDDGRRTTTPDDVVVATTTTNVFRHVTSLTTASDGGGEPSSSSSSSGGIGGPTVLAVLAYCCVRLAHLSHDAFGDPRASVRLYGLAASIDPSPSGVAYHGIGTSVEASVSYNLGEGGGGGGRKGGGDGGGGGGSERMAWRREMERAVEAYREASVLGGGLGSNGEVLFHLAVALEVRWTPSSCSCSRVAAPVFGMFRIFFFVYMYFSTIFLPSHLPPSAHKSPSSEKTSR